MDALDAILRADDLVAVLGREVPVRLLEISVSGCLLECRSRLDVGRHGSLRVVFDDAEFSDDVRIVLEPQADWPSPEGSKTPLLFP